MCGQLRCGFNLDLNAVERGAIADIAAEAWVQRVDVEARWALTRPAAFGRLADAGWRFIAERDPHRELARFVPHARGSAVGQTSRGCIFRMQGQRLFSRSLQYTRIVIVGRIHVPLVGRRQ